MALTRDNEDDGFSSQFFTILTHKFIFLLSDTSAYTSLYSLKSCVWKNIRNNSNFLISIELPSPFPGGGGAPGRFSSGEEASGLLAKDAIGVLFEGEKIFWGEDASFV